MDKYIALNHRQIVVLKAILKDIVSESRNSFYSLVWPDAEKRYNGSFEKNGPYNNFDEAYISGAAAIEESGCLEIVFASEDENPVFRTLYYEDNEECGWYAPELEKLGIIEKYKGDLYKITDFAVNETKCPEIIYVRNISADLADIFEDYLSEKNIKLPDKYREGDEDEAAIYGEVYSEFESYITNTLSIGLGMITRVKESKHFFNSGCAKRICTFFDEMCKGFGYSFPKNELDELLKKTFHFINVLADDVEANPYKYSNINTEDYNG